MMVFYYYRPVSPISNSGTTLCGLAVALLFCILTSRHPRTRHELTLTLCSSPFELSQRQKLQRQRLFPWIPPGGKNPKSALQSSPFEFPHGLPPDTLLWFTYCVREAALSDSILPPLEKKLQLPARGSLVCSYSSLYECVGLQKSKSRMYIASAFSRRKKCSKMGLLLFISKCRYC